MHLQPNFVSFGHFEPPIFRNENPEVADILRCACVCGRVAIVTLAQHPWVLNSAAKYLPGLASRVQALFGFLVSKPPGAKRDWVGRKRQLGLTWIKINFFNSC